MNYFESWTKHSETVENENDYKAYISKYYELEKNAYDAILKKYPDNEDLLNGKAVELAEKLGFGKENMEIFVGFLEGISTSLTQEYDYKSVDDDSDVALKVDYEKLYYNMRDAKAEWLFTLKSWDNVLTPEKQQEITKQYREDNIVHVEKIGRNDPCPCGSGKKYKKCCGKKEN
ncbi:MAG: SEC-C domain-containing protein [Clostridiales bacterium]|nr:SEC-C domain-containing protein [Erysipelotrichaceae bacterium]MBQ4184839.1 SEC-C domain-containing protein [Clostridiales bacterium]MBQ6270338.1 SEC-C domain-containing protein [Clostridiales bacterium]MCR5058502.1 SEC-C domain-containing protein [Clostridiales bacterium]